MLASDRIGCLVAVGAYSMFCLRFIWRT